MPLYIEDAEVERLAGKIAERRNVSKSEAVRLALKRDLASFEPSSSLEKGLALSRALRAQADPAGGSPVGKAFIDSLHED